LPVGDVDRSFVGIVDESVASTFKVKTKVGGEMVLPNAALHEGRGQYNADVLLTAARGLRETDAFRTILVTGADIYAGELPYVLCHATPDGKLMLLSTARLERTGRVEMPLDVLRSRVNKLTIRLFSASLKMKACDSDCVLAGELNIETLDKVPGYFCSECATVLKHRLETDIGSPYSHYVSATYYAQAGEFGNAVEEFKKAIALKGDYLTAYLDLAKLYERHNWLAEALDTLRKTLEIAPDSLLARNRIAQVYLLTDQPRLALEQLHTALAMDKESLEAHRLLFITYKCYMNDPKRAQAQKKKFLELGGDPGSIELTGEYLQPPFERSEK
jgi:predicted Zn-dependent protease/Tfp pilus assembly protein PilF